MDKAQPTLLEIHCRALCAHAESLALNAANMFACVVNSPPPYNEDHYAQILQKWNLIDEEGEPKF